MDDLGLEDDAVEITLGATLRVGQCWRLRFDYFRYSDDANKSVEKDFDFDGVRLAEMQNSQKPCIPVTMKASWQSC